MKYPAYICLAFCLNISSRNRVEFAQHSKFHKFNTIAHDFLNYLELTSDGHTATWQSEYAIEAFVCNKLFFIPGIDFIRLAFDIGICSTTHLRVLFSVPVSPLVKLQYHFIVNPLGK